MPEFFAAITLALLANQPASAFKVDCRRLFGQTTGIIEDAFPEMSQLSDADFLKSWLGQRKLTFVRNPGYPKVPAENRLREPYGVVGSLGPRFWRTLRRLPGETIPGLESQLFVGYPQGKVKIWAIYRRGGQIPVGFYQVATFNNDVRTPQTADHFTAMEYIISKQASGEWMRATQRGELIRWKDYVAKRRR